MKINIVCNSYIDSTACNNLGRDEAIELYHKSFSASDNSLMNHYFKYFNPFDENKINNQIYKYYLDLMEKRELYNQLCKFNIENQIMEKLLRDLPIFQSIVEEIEINFFIGIGTAHGFITSENNKAFINIALERFVNSKEPYKHLECTIIHELVHLARMKTRKFSWAKLGYTLIEEGLACLISKTVTGLTEKDDDLVFPGFCKLSDEECDKLINLYLNNIYSEDMTTISKLMNLGDPNLGVKPGLGYIIGAKLLTHYIEYKSIGIYELIYSDNHTIVSNWLELRDALVTQ